MSRNYNDDYKMLREIIYVNFLDKIIAIRLKGYNIDICCYQTAIHRDLSSLFCP